MRISARTGDGKTATLFVAEMDNGKHVEFVDSVQPPIPMEQKWVLIVSTLYGCPVGCGFCDAGSRYEGKLSRDEIVEQIDYLVIRRFPDRRVPVEKFKVQFARMGEPSLNQDVLDVLSELPELYEAPGLMPCLSTVAPDGTGEFFDRMLEIKKDQFDSNFQLQFSIHTTDEKLRDWLIPVKKWDFDEIGEYGEAFYDEGGRKVTLNFALANGMPVDPKVLLPRFSPDVFLIKITPVNPTYQAVKKKISSHILPEKEEYEIVDSLKSAGYDVILSIGELEENHIGSNCGQQLMKHLREKGQMAEGYTYRIHRM